MHDYDETDEEPVDLLAPVILKLLRERKPGAMICPSEAARRLDPEGWRGWMDSTREAARKLAASGRIEICQRGRTVEPINEWRGPIRLRLPRTE